MTKTAHPKANILVAGAGAHPSPSSFLLRPALAGLGPLGLAPAHPGHSLRDGVTFRFRGGIRRTCRRAE
jgi:hypothetical protein